MMDNTEKLLIEARFFTYTLFQKLFGNEPTNELLELLCSEETADILRVFDFDEADAYGKALRFLDEFAADFAENPKACLDAAKREYMRCFIGPSRLALPAWESVYLSRDHLLFQESTLDVRRFFRAHGVALDIEGNEADDHVAFECGFMALMARRAAEAGALGDERKRDGSLTASARFLDEHLLVWTPLFAAKADEAKDPVLYPQLAKLLAAFLKVDAAVLEDLVPVN